MTNSKDSPASCISNGNPKSNGHNNSSTSGGSSGNERPLKCLETLAQKAGITFDEKYDFASSSATASTPPPHQQHHNTHHLNSDKTSTVTLSLTSPSSSTPTPSTTSYTSSGNKSFTLEKSQSPAQQVAPNTVPLQMPSEQLQQLQQLHQLQNGSPFAAIQVKQQFPNQQNTLTGSGSTTTEIKHSGQMQLAQAAADTDGGAGQNSPATQHTPTSAGAVTAMHQHSATISTMSPRQLATGQVTAAGDWTQGRTVQLMQPSTGFLYPHMLMSGNLIQSGLGQQPIQVIAAGKPFQGGAPQMIATTQNTKQMSIGGNTGFPSGTTYAIPSSQSPQTLLFSPVNVISQSPQQQQQNILQAMAAANVQQQQQQQQQKGTADAQKGLQQKVVQKVTTTTNSVQSGAIAAAQQHQQQQQQQATQQCAQVNAQSTGMPTGTTQIISPIQQTTGQPQPLQINAAPWVQSVPFWPNGLQQLTQNAIILRGTQPDGTQGVYIQQPTGQTLQTQQPNQITLQCNVTQTPTKQSTQLYQLQAKQQQSAQTQLQVQQQQQVSNVQQQQRQQAIVQAHLQQQTAPAIQQRGQTQISPQAGGAQIRPASSVSTQMAQNQSLLKQKLRTKQQAVRPTLPAMKTEPQIIQQQQQQQVVNATTVAGLQQQITAAVAAQQQQQQQQQSQPTMHQVVTSAGNKMVVMSTGTPITIQNGQTLQQAIDKQQQQQQQQQLHLQQIQKQQQQQQVYLQQQLIQQQIAQIQLQHQQQQQAAVHQHQQQQLQQQAVVAAQQQQQQQAQIKLQVGPQGFIAAQQQQQLQNQLLQQQQQLQQHPQQQRDQQQQSQNIIHQIVVQQSPQQQQQQTQQLQQQISAVPFSVSSSTPASIATSQALQQQFAYQTKTSNSLPTTSVITISNQTGPLVTSTVGLNQATTTIAASRQQQQQQQQLQQQQTQQLVAVAQQQQQQQQYQTLTPPPSSPAQNPLAMASTMNAAGGGNLPGTSSLTTAVSMTSPIGSNTTQSNVSSLPATPTKAAIEQFKTVSSAPNTPSTGQIHINTASATSTPITINSDKATKETPTKISDNDKTPEACTKANNATQHQQQHLQSQPQYSPTNTNPTETPQLVVQPMDTTETSNESSITKESNTVASTTTTTTTSTSSQATESSTQASITKAQKSSNNSNSTELVEQTLTQISSVQSFLLDESTIISPATTTTSANTTCTTSISTSSCTATTTPSTFTTSTTSNSTSTTTTATAAQPSSTLTSNKSPSGPPPKSTPGATTVKVEKDLPKAMIKPNVLTHFIDGFIIQEANKPFPVTRKRYIDKDDSDELPQKKLALDDATNKTNNNLSISPVPSDMVACEQCGKPEHKTKLKKKRFCSPTCASLDKASIGEQTAHSLQQTETAAAANVDKNNTNEANTNNLNNSINVDINNQMTTSPMAEKMETDNITLMQTLPIIQQPQLSLQQQQQQQPPPSSSSTTTLPSSFTLMNDIAPKSPAAAAVAAPTPAVEQQPQMANWSVSDVCEFIKNLPGCNDYVDDFEQHEIDGEALLLLKENHLVNAMGMKLGPALKIVAKVESMKEVSAAALNAANNPPTDGNNAN